MLKKSLLVLLVAAFGFTTVAEAQLRGDLPRSGDFTGAVISTDRSASSSSLSQWLESLNVTMGHSYSMNFGSVGGQFQNINAYTNHMMFDFSESLTGQLDISVLHSPFGNSMMNMGNNDLGARVIIDRAQLDYQISPNTSLSLRFSQRPYYSPYGMGLNPFPFGNRQQFRY